MKKFFLLLFLLCNISYAAPFEKLVFFGDSLTDNGNLYRILLKLIPKSPPYYKGRFSNGPTWAEGVGRHYDEKYKTSYKIYALGGATAIYHPPTDKFISPTTLNAQLDSYFLDTTLQDKSKTLFAIWIGGNDYIFDLRTDPETLSSKVTEKTAESINKLIKKGAQNFLVLNLPDITKSPLGRGRIESPRFELLTKLHNEKLIKAMEAIKQNHPQVKIIFMNVFDMFNDVIANPEKYNEKYNGHITDTTTACWKGGYFLHGSQYDNRLAQRLEAELKKRWYQQHNAYPTDAEVKHLTQMVMTSPSLRLAYELGDTYELGLTKLCDKPNEHLFWDQLHPTEIVHRVLSEIVVDMIDFALPG